LLRSTTARNPLTYHKRENESLPLSGVKARTKKKKRVLDMGLTRIVALYINKHPRVLKAREPLDNHTPQNIVVRKLKKKKSGGDAQKNKQGRRCLPKASGKTPAPEVRWIGKRGSWSFGSRKRKGKIPWGRIHIRDHKKEKLGWSTATNPGLRTGSLKGGRT